MRRVLTMLCVLAALFAPATADWAQPKPARPSIHEPMSAAQIADAILQREFARRDAALTALSCADAKTCDELAGEILACGVREAQMLLDCLACCGNDNTLNIAFVVLDSDLEDVRLAALDVMLDAPFEWLGKSGEKLTAERRKRLLELLVSKAALERRADGMGTGKRDAYSMKVTVQLGMLTDRHFGAPGYIMLLRRLAEIMLGDAPANPGEEPPPEKPEVDERDPERSRALQEHRRRAGAAALFRDLWIEDLLLFNYLPDANYKRRLAAVERIRSRLDEMEKQSLTLGDKQYTGVRCGDYLLQLLESDNNDVKAAAYLRLAAASGTSVKGVEELPALTGETYSAAVTELLKLSRREFAELRRKLRDWWAEYRKSTER